MKKILLMLLLLFITSVHAQLAPNQMQIFPSPTQSCSNPEKGTILLYVNGQENSREDLDESVFEVATLLADSSLQLARRIDQNQNVNLDYVFNPTMGKVSNLGSFSAWADFIESTSLILQNGLSAYKLSRRQSWVIAYSVFSLGMAYSTIKGLVDGEEVIISEDIKVAIRQGPYTKLLTEEVLVSNDLINKLKLYLLTQEKKVVVISHSQGNLFTNRAYQSLQGTSLVIEGETRNFNDYTKFLGNAQIATPANSILIEKHNYITNHLDAINGVPGSLVSNFPSGGFPYIPPALNFINYDFENHHGLLSAYLFGYVSDEDSVKNLTQQTIQNWVDVAGMLESNCEDQTTMPYATACKQDPNGAEGEKICLNGSFTPVFAPTQWTFARFVGEQAPDEGSVPMEIDNFNNLIYYVASDNQTGGFSIIVHDSLNMSFKYKVPLPTPSAIPIPRELYVDKQGKLKSLTPKFINNQWKYFLSDYIYRNQEGNECNPSEDSCRLTGEQIDNPIAVDYPGNFNFFGGSSLTYDLNKNLLVFAGWGFLDNFDEFGNYIGTNYDLDGDGFWDQKVYIFNTDSNESVSFYTPQARHSYMTFTDEGKIMSYMEYINFPSSTTKRHVLNLYSISKNQAGETQLIREKFINLLNIPQIALLNPIALVPIHIRRADFLAINVTYAIPTGSQENVYKRLFVFDAHTLNLKYYSNQMAVKYPDQVQGGGYWGFLTQLLPNMEGEYFGLPWESDEMGKANFGRVNDPSKPNDENPDPISIFY